MHGKTIKIQNRLRNWQGSHNLHKWNIHIYNMNIYIQSFKIISTFTHVRNLENTRCRDLVHPCSRDTHMSPSFLCPVYGTPYTSFGCGVSYRWQKKG